MKECTKATVLHPYLAFICALLDLKKPYSDLKTIKSDFLSHSTYQFYFLNAECDDYFYRPSEAGDSIQNYGLSWMNFKIDLDMSEFLNQVKTEIKYSSDFYQMSSVEAGVWPLILTGCRHYRLPIPLHFFLNEETERVNTENSN